MKNYELTYLISPELSEENAKTSQEKVISFIQEKGGILLEKKLPFKKNLAYSIKKQSQAFLTTINFQLLPEKLASLEEKIKKENQVLRYLLLIKLQPKKIKAVPRKLVPRGTPFPPKEKKVKVELKEIEKKLEEILSES